MTSSESNQMYKLCIKTASGKRFLLTNKVSGSSSLNDLKTAISNVTSIENNHQKLLIGFPPKPISYNRQTSLANIGIRNGEVIIVETCEDSSVFEKLECSSSPPINGLHLQKDDSKKYHSPVRSTRQLDKGDVTLTSHLEPKSKSKKSKGGAYSLACSPALNAGATLEKMVVPSDNSCLFSSIFYLVHNGCVEVKPDDIHELRNNVATIINSDPETYCEAILEKNNSDYCNWILKETSWGGAIEVKILSNWYSLEIVSLDVTNLVVSRFGEDQNYEERIILLYDGIHYDPVQLRDDKSKITTRFLTEDHRIIEMAKEMMIKAKNAGQFTDTGKFKIICGDCETYLRGEVETLQHAKATGHTNFRERT